MLHAPVSENKTQDKQSKTQSEPESERRALGWAGSPGLGLGGENGATAGNQRAQGWQPINLSALSQGGILQRKCACGSSAGAAGTCEECQSKEGGMLQTKLSIGAPGDKYEQEADRVADRVMSASPNSVVNSAPPRIQRFTGQTTGLADMVAPASVDSVLSSPGSPLESGLEQDMGQRFGHDFSRVRVHTDAAAARSAREVNANAYTVGHNIVFGVGKYQPHNDEGKQLLAHELAHVLQQNPKTNATGPSTNFSNETHPVIRRKAADPEVVPLSPASAPAPAPAPTFASSLDYDSITEELRKAMAGLGTDEEAVYFALNRLKRDPEAIQLLKNRYKKKYKVELLDEIHDEFSGTELEYALQLLNVGKNDSSQDIAKAAPASREEWRKAAQRLRDAFEGMGTDEEAVYAVLTPFRRQPPLITMLKTIYQALFKEPLRDRIEDEMSGSELDYALWLMGEQPIHEHEPEAESQAQQVLGFIISEGAKRAKAPPSIDPSSNFYTTLRTRYLSGYFTNPTPETGRKAVEEEIGRPMEGKLVKVDNKFGVMVRPKGGGWRLPKNEWEVKGITWLNKQELPSQLAEMKDMPLLKHLQGLPRDLGAATDILIAENVATLPFIDVPFLIGKPNLDTSDINADVQGGGKNISQLMHWATGVKYSKQPPEALRELFLAYEMWHLEGWDVFGQDALNDMIAENQGRILGAELLKGSAGALKTEADLLPFLNRSFLESRAWVGTLLRMRRAELDAWILVKQEKPASMHWMEKENIWNSLTVYQMLADKIPLDEVKKSFIVESAIEIYTLVYEAIEWEQAHGPIKLTGLEKALVQGKLDSILEVMARAEVGKASLPDLLKAKSAIDDLKGVK
jgi:hypothetical protein